MKVFFTSDTFFGRSLSAANRGFATTEEMDDRLIDLWNERVDKNDLVFHLGNFAWDPVSAEYAICSLNGKINFVDGAMYDSFIHELSLSD